jgi:hypothetical protein
MLSLPETGRVRLKIKWEFLKEEWPPLNPERLIQDDRRNDRKTHADKIIKPLTEAVPSILGEKQILDICIYLWDKDERT